MSFKDVDKIMKQSMEYYKRTRDKFILIEYDYSKRGLDLKMSVVNGKEYVIIGNDLNAMECVRLISRLWEEYERIILDVNIGLINCINEDLNRNGLYLNLEQLKDEYILSLLRQDSRLSVIGAYVESRELTYNEKMLKL